ncbi:hypothetical protein, partial [Escherichia coli]
DFRLNSPSRYFSDTTFLNSNENFSMHPQFLVWCLTFGAQFKNDGHYFCRAGGNRPDGLNEPVTAAGFALQDNGRGYCHTEYA